MGKITDLGKSSFDAILLHRLEKESPPLRIIFMAAFSFPPCPSISSAQALLTNAFYQIPRGSSIGSFCSWLCSKAVRTGKREFLAGN